MLLAAATFRSAGSCFNSLALLNPCWATVPSQLEKEALQWTQKRSSGIEHGSNPHKHAAKLKLNAAAAHQYLGSVQHYGNLGIECCSGIKPSTLKNL